MITRSRIWQVLTSGSFINDVYTGRGLREKVGDVLLVDMIASVREQREGRERQVGSGKVTAWPGCPAQTSPAKLWDPIDSYCLLVTLSWLFHLLLSALLFFFHLYCFLIASSNFLNEMSGLCFCVLYISLVSFGLNADWFISSLFFSWPIVVNIWCLIILRV